ncbi:hypothetical protein H5410_019445 [Solanum commersonii]|uniref:Uncharacterized protein n=1 Tax=Solanum commersonii TaxID=4109 RepID=A0A9J5Z9L9_SOLCO|nr:hypothetical protein H5410_019445 [Solanum commersonii]
MSISPKLAEPNKHLGSFICIPDDQVFVSTVTTNDMDKISFPNTSSSLAVRIELLVYGKYTKNTWSSRMQMNAPRCLFCSTSFGEISILAGGCDSWGVRCVLQYLWIEILCNWRHWKNRVIKGAIDTVWRLILSETGKWTEISSMSPV